MAKLKLTPSADSVFPGVGTVRGLYACLCASAAGVSVAGVCGFQLLLQVSTSLGASSAPSAIAANSGGAAADNRKSTAQFCILVK
jgi:hypothetical protein